MADQGLSGVGVDPGLSGAIAIVAETSHGFDVEIFDMPVVEMKTGGKLRRRVDIAALCSVAAYVAATAPRLASVEDLSGRPPVKGASQSGQFQQGWNACAPVVALASAGLAYRMVTPAVWKKRLGVPSNKDAARAIAAQEFPTAAHLFARKKDDGRAEAALLGKYAIMLARGER